MKKAIFALTLTAIGVAVTAAITLARQEAQPDPNVPAETKEYLNTEFNYSLEYPASWSLMPSPDSPVGHVKVLSANAQSDGDQMVAGTFFEVYVLPKNDAQSLASWLSEKDAQNPETVVLSQENTTLDSRPGIKRVVGTFGNPEVPSFDVFVDDGDRVYEFAGIDSAETQTEIEAILSSVRILR